MRENQKKCLIVITIFMGVLFVVWLAQVIYVNKNTRKTIYEYYEYGEECEYKGFNIKVVDYEKMSDLDFIEKYNLPMSVITYDRNRYDVFVCLVTLEFRKMDKQSDFELYDASDFKLVSTGESNMVNYTFFDAMDYSENKEFSELMVGESFTMTFPVSFVKQNLAKYYHENFDKYPLYVQFLDYEGSEYIRMLEVK
jgi:hypothetical protein